jgi:hypothetical protein
MSFLTRAKAALRVLAGTPDRSPGMTLVSSRHNRYMRKGAREVLEAYSHSPLIRAVAHKVAHMVAASTWYVEIDGEAAEADHPAAEFLRRGSPVLDALRRDIFMQLTEDLVGEAAALIATDRENGLGTPVRLYAFPPTWIHQVPTENRDYFMVQPSGGGRAIKIPRHQILHRKSVDPVDPYGRGSGLGLSLGDEIAVDEAAAQHMAHTLQNNARPDMIITGGKESPLDQIQADRLREKFMGHQGPTNAGLPMIASSPVEVTTMAQSFKDLTLADIRRFELEIIVAVWGIAPELIGQVQNSNRATIDAADYLVSAHTILPRLKLTAAALNHQVAPLFGDDVAFCFLSPVEEDKEYNLEVMKSRPQAFMDDEVRAAAGMQPLPNGLGRVIPRSPIFEYVTVPGDDVQPVQARMASLTKTPTQGDVDAALRELDNTDGLSQAMRAVLTDALAAFGSAALDGVGLDIDFSLQDPRVVEWLENASADRVTQINDTTRTRLQSALSEGVGSGETADQLVGRVQAEMDGTTVSRARTIGRTEVVRASNFATHEGLRQGGVTQRQWLAVQGVGVGFERDEVRPSHDALDGLVVELDQPFVIPVGHANSGASAMYPGDFGIAEEDINCRCTILPVLNLAPEQRLALWKQRETDRNPYERQLDALMLRAISEQLNRVAKALKNR